MADYMIEMMPRVRRHNARINRDGYKRDLMVSLSLKVNAVMLAFKDAGFREEQEWRIVGHLKGSTKLRPGRSGVVPYACVPLCTKEDKPRIAQFTIGPNQEPELAKEGVRMVFPHIAPHSNYQLVSSKIPYRY